MPSFHIRIADSFRFENASFLFHRSDCEWARDCPPPTGIVESILKRFGLQSKFDIEMDAAEIGNGSNWDEPPATEPVLMPSRSNKKNAIGDNEEL